MQDLKISLGISRNATAWLNKTSAWDVLCGKLRTTTRTRETVAEYKKMTRQERERIKDKGGFVGGHIKNGRRLLQNVVCRSLLTLDADNADAGFIDRFVRECRYAAVIYTTHGHTPEAPRVRIVIPFKQEITPDRYAPVARYYAAEWGIDQFDVCSYRANQLMYWPTTPADGEYVCRVVDGPFMDADEFLKRHPGWDDCSNWPTASGEKVIRTTESKKQEDPLTKTGIVGAFCRTYTIQEAIGKFLSDVYAPSDVEDRYDYIPGEGACGVVVYDDKFAYSHHATDPSSGKLCNAFDLVRLHRFKDMSEKESFVKMCEFAESDEPTAETLAAEKLEQAKKDFDTVQASGIEPIPFGRYEVAPFPVDALPPDFRDYAEAVAESTQTPVDMSGAAMIALTSVCVQGKYVVQVKSDWREPMNTFINIIANPSERKSAVLRADVKAADSYEVRYNMEHAASVEGSKMRKNILERRKKAIEEQIAKGKGDSEELDRIAQEIANFREEKPLQLYVDDITTEKLVSVMSANHGRAALVSSEGGIFDTLAGIYTRNVNIDVMLKGYSGDTIRVDRIGRESESIMNPSLTLLLMTQPKVISDVLSNATFRGRGLTARFLYCMPTSIVGERQFQSKPVTEEVYRRYEQKIVDMLEEEYPDQPQLIRLSEEASVELTAFAEELEPKMKAEYIEIADWVGKLVGNTVRIAGLLCRAGVYRASDFLVEPEALVIDGETMRNAIRLGRYFLSHALAVYDAIPESNMHRQARQILQFIQEGQLQSFDRRMAMRGCRTFKTVAEIQPVLDFLEDYGYIFIRDENNRTFGRPRLPHYIVNPAVLSLPQ